MHTKTEEVASVFLPNDRPQVLLGLDNHGEVFTYKGSVFRGIFTGYGKQALEVFIRCNTSGLFDKGIVKTTIIADESLLHLGYDLVFQHERIPFITYAHEWSPQMFKDAALFQLDLNMQLIAEGLVLKDCGSHANILFNDTTPVHVDFLSIIPIEELVNQDWLKPVSLQEMSLSSAMFYEVFKRIFFPGMLYPLYLMHQGKTAYAQKRIFETFLNTAHESIDEDEAFAHASVRLRTHYNYYSDFKIEALRNNDWIRFLEIQRIEIEQLVVTLKSSGYSDYYDLKGENFSFSPSSDWKTKQWGIYKALQKFKPKTVLDIGANTGWFSVLAATCGAKVIAAEIDAACADILYDQLRRDKYSVQPLVLDILNATPDVPVLSSLADDPHFLDSRFNNNSPLLLKTQRRLKCDCVLALAIIHHICLGQGVHIADAVDLLAGYSNEILLLEFVTKDDPLVVSEPDFFKAHYANPPSFDWYSVEVCVKFLRTHFDLIEQVLHSDTRIILVCSGKKESTSGKTILHKTESINHYGAEFESINKILSEWENIRSKPPLNIVIETSTGCTRKCIYCPISVVKRPNSKLADNVVLNLIDQLHAWNFKGNLSFQFINEPLLDTRLFSFMEYAQNKLTDVTLCMATNGDLLSEEMALKFLEICDEIRITQHDQEFARELEINEFLSAHPAYKHKLSILRPGWEPQNWGGLITKIKTTPWTSFRNQCRYFNTLIIDAYGQSVQCCQDAEAKNGFGSIYDFSLMDIWKRSEQKRQLLFLGKHVEAFELCKCCTGLTKHQE